MRVDFKLERKEMRRKRNASEKEVESLDYRS